MNGENGRRKKKSIVAYQCAKNIYAPKIASLSQIIAYTNEKNDQKRIASALHTPLFHQSLFTYNAQ